MKRTSVSDTPRCTVSTLRATMPRASTWRAAPRLRIRRFRSVCSKRLQRATRHTNRRARRPYASPTPVTRPRSGAGMRFPEARAPQRNASCSGLTPLGLETSAFPRQRSCGPATWILVEVPSKQPPLRSKQPPFARASTPRSRTPTSATDRLAPSANASRYRASAATRPLATTRW